MILINEILPDPEGNDKEGEFVEFFNSGSETVFLNGWSFSDKKKSFSLSGYKIESNGYLVIDYKVSKVTLNNSDEIIYLYKGNELVDEVEILGKAPTGESLSRDGDNFFFTREITKGEVNAVPIKIENVETAQALNLGEGFFVTMVATGFLMAGLALWVYRIVYE